MGEERFDLDPLAAPLREPEVRLPDPVEQTHLRFVRDVQVEDGPVELPDDVLAGQAVLDQELVEDFPRPEEFSLERLLDESLDLFGSDRARDLVQDVRVDRRAEGGGDLQRVHRASHVPFRDVDEGFHPVVRDLELLRLGDPSDVLGDRIGLERAEPEDRRAGLNRLDEPRRVVGGQDEAGRLRIRLHRAPQGGLGVRRQVVGLVEEDDLEVRPAERREARDLFDLRPHRVDTALVAAVQLEVVLAPVLAKHVEGEGARRLAGARGTREEEVRQVPRLRIGFEAFDDFLLADDLVQALRSILLDPKFLHRRPNARRIREMRNKALAGTEPNLLEGEVQEVRDRGDRVDERRRRPAGEEEADRVPAFVDNEGAAVATLRQEVAHDLLPEDRRRAAVVHFDDRIDGRDAACRDAGRAPALADPHPDIRFLRAAHPTDAQDVRRDEPRLDRLGHGRVDEVRVSAREALEAPARGAEQRPEQPRQEPCDRPGLPFLELDRHEIDEAGNRVLQAAAVRGPGLQDRVADSAGVLVRQDMVVRQDDGPPVPPSEDAERPGSDLHMADAHTARRRTDPFRPFEVDRLFGPQRMEAARFDDVRPDAAERLRDDVPMSQLAFRFLRLDEDDDAALVRLAAADALVADRDPDYVRPGEDVGLVRRLRGADVVRWHASLLALERADLEEAFAELAARRRAGHADDHVRDEADEDADSVVREEVPGVQEGHHADAEDDRHERREGAPLDLVPAHREQEEPTQDDPHEDEAELVDVHSVPSENGRNAADSG